MSVDRINNNNYTYSHIAIDAGVGAILTGGVEYITQKNKIKHPEKYNEDYFLKNAKEIEELKSPKFIVNYLKKVNDNMIKVVKSGKVNWGGIAKASVIGAISLVGINYAINKLFNKKSAEP